MFEELFEEVNDFKVVIIVTESRGNFNDRVKETEKFLSEKFGGATTLFGQGAWKNNGELVNEKIGYVFSYTDYIDYQSERQDVRDFVKSKLDEWEQTSMMMVEDGNMKLFWAEEEEKDEHSMENIPQNVLG